MSLSLRERRAVAILPALLLIALYGFWVRPAREVRLEQAELRLGRLKDAPECAVPEVETLALRRAELEARLRESERGVGEMLSRWSVPERRPEAVNALSRAIERGGLRLERSSAEDDREADLLRPRLRLLERRMLERGGAKLETRRFDLQCTWKQLLDLLRSVEQLDVFAMPATLTIRPVDAGSETLNVSLWFRL